MENLRVLELYSGIGGMHYALTESGVAAKVVAAVDVNTTANEIYKHNFPNTPLLPKTIEGMTLDDFNKLSFDMILMSPPCQPFTRIGLQGDISDPRTKSFLYILDLLPRLIKLPRFILLENVKGFETSSARDSLVKTLKECGYNYQELMVSPTCLGMPNSRLRYFMIAKAPPGSFSFHTTSEIQEGFPHPADKVLLEPSSPISPSPTTTAYQEEDHKEDEGGILYKLERAQDAERKSSQNRDQSLRQIRVYLEDQGEGEMEQYLLPPKTLLRYALLMDIVRPTCRRSVCFTKGYGHYVEGTGSVLQSCMETDMEAAFRSPECLSDEEKLQQLSRLKLRYFSPREIANLMGFPKHFTIPKNISTKQQYRVLGNSLNVHVVARLIELLVS
ncbi:tRNA (cytosine(38)-C(5))-methyltransferase [Salmo salar]|uniref:tRNA (cytosine(38)-C(5))-methyltransferase n=1 Tax=Salmo salar TaxID=8030 RepID=A0A1S3NBQ6_SALSA|nr:tRNA (cytosine(38)-C(5))-methyltransferase [Salmo salar]|eukprot:XP_014012889.1 PREDICTED: tRNA (cytosine(38)-C(5))-methyltransferase isoform X1 [Salmo salar]